MTGKVPPRELLDLWREHGIITGQLRATKNKKDRLRLLERLRVVGEKIMAIEAKK